MHYGRPTVAVLLTVAALALGGCAGSMPRFTSRGAAAAPGMSASHQLDGVASYYADDFNGRATASGETYNMNAFTAAHQTLPFGTMVRVTNRQNGRSVVVRINDRGPFKDERVIDLSLAAAKQIGLIASGTAPVTIDLLDPDNP